MIKNNCFYKIILIGAWYNIHIIAVKKKIDDITTRINLISLVIYGNHGKQNE